MARKETIMANVYEVGSRVRLTQEANLECAWPEVEGIILETAGPTTVLVEWQNIRKGVSVTIWEIVDDLEPV